MLKYVKWNWSDCSLRFSVKKMLFWEKKATYIKFYCEFMNNLISTLHRAPFLQFCINFFSVLSVFYRGAEVSDCGRWLIITPKKGCQDNLMYYYDLHTLPDGKISGQLKLSPIIEKLECDYDVSFLIFALLSSVSSLLFPVQESLVH